jgi:dCTP diphosphatase
VKPPPSGALEPLIHEVRAFVAERDWEQFHSPRNLAMALSVEAGELLELFLWSRDDGPQPMVASRIPKVADEAADVFLCLLNLCDRQGIDLEAALRDKLERARRKYPADVVRGQALKYDEYPDAEEPDTSGR